MLRCRRHNGRAEDRGHEGVHGFLRGGAGVWGARRVCGQVRRGAGAAGGTFKGGDDRKYRAPLQEASAFQGVSGRVSGRRGEAHVPISGGSLACDVEARADREQVIYSKCFSLPAPLASFETCPGKAGAKRARVECRAPVTVLRLTRKLNRGLLLHLVAEHALQRGPEVRVARFIRRRRDGRRPSPCARRGESAEQSSPVHASAGA